MGLARIAGKKIAEKATEGALESVAKQSRAIGKKSDVIPPPFERAPAKTKAEIDAIARRVAPQLTGEFVKLDPTKSVNPAGLSKKRFDIEKELEHDIRPVREVAQPSIFDYESNVGKVQLGVFGDPTIAQQDIYSIAGKELPIPSRQFGGPRYPMYEPEDAWASNFGAASGLQSGAERASKQYGGADVVGLYTKMGKDSYYYAQHLSDALMKNIMASLPDMNKKQIAGFNRMVRNNPDAKDFAGIENPDIALAQMEKNPEMRKQFAMLATTPTYTTAFNMPNGLDVVHAVLEPELRNLERGITGYTAIELDPNVTHLHATDRASTTTYDTRIPRKQGAEVQQLEVLAPYDLQYPDQLLAISKNPKQAPQPFGTLMMSGARQIIDPQHVDEMGLYREFIKKYTGKKKGGKVHADGSPKLSNGASASKMADYILNKYAGGGVPKKIGEKLAEKVAKSVSKNIELPPASNSARTQIVGTLPTYEKARDILAKEGIQGADIIDFGAGKGLGSTMMKAHSFEPYPQGWYPTYTKSEDIPSDAYKGLLNLNVLNVLDPEMRAHTVKEIGRVMQPEGGTGLITTRGRDVLNTVGGVEGPEPMSIITSRDTYQKGFTPDELKQYLKFILGSDFEYEPLNLGPAGVKVKKKADGGEITLTTPEIEVKPEDKPEVLTEVPRGKISGKIADILKPASEFLGKYEILPQVPLLGGTSLAELTGVEGVQTLAEDISRGYKPIRNLERGKLQTSFFDPRMLDAIDLATTAAGGIGLAKKLGKEGAKEIARQVQTGEGIIGRNVINPRQNIIKDPGGMLVGGERDLDSELLNMKKTETGRYPTTILGEYEKDPHAVALNQWIDTKVRKYIRNQLGTEADPIRKAIDSGVEHNFQPALGDTKYYVKNKRAQVGKPEEGVATTDLGKEWEYKADSMFFPKKSAEIKEILNTPMEHLDPSVEARRKASLLRVEQDLPIQNEQDLEALKLIHQIPDPYVYTMSGTNVTERLGLNHVADVLYEDMASGKLKPEQLNQMSIEKAIRRTAEYDAQKAREMEKAHATSIEGMPIPKQYDDGYKWVELKHDDAEKTKGALKSEGQMMGHCVGGPGYCNQVLGGGTKIYSLRGPDGKSHVTIEASKRSHLNSWINANKEEIDKDPLLKDIAYSEPDTRNFLSEEEETESRIFELTKFLKMKGVPVKEDPNAWIELVQVKGKQNKRPEDKYQKYVSDFITNNPTGHEIVDVHELNNTDVISAERLIGTGLAPKKVHEHPDVEKILKIKHPDVFRSDMPKVPKSFSRSEELKYELFQEAARDLIESGKNYFTEDDLLNHIQKKYLPSQKKSGGPINLNQEYKLENMRRRYG